MMTTRSDSGAAPEPETVNADATADAARRKPPLLLVLGLAALAALAAVIYYFLKPEDLPPLEDAPQTGQ